MKNTFSTLLLLAAAAAPFFSAAHANTHPGAPTALRVNLLKNAYSIDTGNLSFSWVVQDEDRNEVQSAYRIVFSKTLSDAASGNYFLDVGWIPSPKSTAVEVSGLSGLIEQGNLYYWQVQTKDRLGDEGPLSEPHPFTTAIRWVNTNGIWHNSAYDDGGALSVPVGMAGNLATENDLAAEKANFVFLRHKFQVEDAARIEKAIVAATAYNTESSRQYVFDLYLNGRSVGVGPARNQSNTPQGNLQYYNSYDVTALLQTGSNAIAAACYNKDDDRAFLLQMAVFYTDGSSEILVSSARDAAAWRGKDGTLAFGQSDEYSSNGSWYRQHKEHINATKYPFGFGEAGFVEDNTWRAVKAMSAVNGDRRLAPYTSENTLRYLMPAGKVAPMAGGGYLVTLEKAIVGGLQLDIDSPTQATIEIRLGEELNDNGSVRSAGRGHPNYVERWTLKQGKQTIRTLNMKSFRYVEIIESPTEITVDNVKGYAVRQEFEDELSDFHSSNSFLNELYEFTKYTIKATNQDVWTDSQARERGPYEGDAIVNMASSNVFSSSYSIGRYSHEYLINNPTWPQEYKLFSVEMAWMDYLYTGDRTSIAKYYAALKNKFPGAFSASTGLVNLQKDVLIDWPPTERDGYSFQAYNTGYNAVYASACRAMASIAGALGNEADRAFYQNRASAIKAAMISKLYNPQKGAFDDSMSEEGALSEHYTQHATAYALACGIYDSPEMAAKMAAYIEGQGVFKTSIYAAFFVLNGLYNAGAGDVAMKLMADENSENVRTWAHVLR
ncbi:MAG: family 78 glycoside hydrolase catalytic domain, partial [Prevotellaceae bacterium]|nr:family 78 glycoside hydrolase catalytic domain [Prevotellaceae bacterium]